MIFFLPNVFATTERLGAFTTITGDVSLRELRDAGVNTEVVRRARRRSRATASGETVVECEVEL